MARLTALLVFVFLLGSTLVLGQDAPPAEPAINGSFVLATFLNGFVIVIFVRLIRIKATSLSPAVLQVITLAAGFAVPWATTFVSDQLGHPVDFGPLLIALNSVITGVVATAEFKALKHIIGNSGPLKVPALKAG